MVSARFDDLTPGAEHAFALVDPVDQLVAWRPEQVIPALAAVERAARLGRWAAGYVAYEAATGLDPLLPVHPPAPGYPLVRFDVYAGRTDVEPASGAEAGGYRLSPWEPGLDEGGFADAVAAIHDAIAAGDTYQVNLTFPMHAQFEGRPGDWYRDLAAAQAGAFNAHLDLGDRHLLSASPELFFSVEGDRITTRPMKGTVRRGRWAGEDAALARGLVSSEKDRAENVMIVDLLRSDLGRVAAVGSVHVDDLFTVERYRTVWQLTSTVSARLRPGIGLVDVFRAVFPSGSVTGAPKRRTMEIIRGLEPAPRGVYCGAIGFVAPGAPGFRAVFNVPIRTVHLDPFTGIATYGVGCGITWGSEAGSEYEEARWKARLLAQRRPDFDLVETMAWEPGAGFRHLDRHLDRLLGSAAYFDFAVDPDAVVGALDDAVAGAGGPRKVRLRAGRSGVVEVETASLDETNRTEPVRFAIGHLPVPPDDVLLFHKTTVRGQYDRPRREQPDVDDVLLVNDRGELTEFTVANVALLVDGVWYTPPLESGVLPGTFRAALVDGGTLVERVLTVADLDAADQVAWLNSMRGWRPTRRVMPAQPGGGIR